MKNLILLLSFMCCCFVTFSQTQICVDGSSGNSEDGTPSNPYHTIQAAVNAASNGDIIKVAQGTYSEAVLISQKKVQLLGGFAGSGDFNSANPHINQTIIEATSTASCICVNIDAHEISGLLTISGFTIHNGKRGIELSGGYSGFLNNIIIENNTIENNGNPAVERGGGIGLEGNNVIIRNNLILNNKARRGAAIGGTSEYISDFLIADNHIENNKGYGDHGGGVIISGTGIIIRNIFDGNVTALSDPSYGWGGGMVVVNYDTTKVILLSHNVWRNNHAPDRGGAVFVDEAAKVSMENELFYNNTTRKSGSAIYVDADWKFNPSVLSMNNCTVSGNSTDEPDGAALYVQGSKANIQNSIFWNNGSDFEAIDDLPARATLTVDYTLTQQGFAAGTGNISSNPLFADASNGDFHVESTIGRFNPSTGLFVNDDENSPAIDAGNPSSDFSNEPDPNGGRVNLGCYGNTDEASKSAGTTGIEEIPQILWTIFPNPAQESVTIGNLPSGSNVNITDITGKKVYGTVIKNEQTTINTASLENGVYIIQITYNGVVANRKLIVRK